MIVRTLTMAAVLLAAPMMIAPADAQEPDEEWTGANLVMELGGIDPNDTQTTDLLCGYVWLAGTGSAVELGKAWMSGGRDNPAAGGKSNSVLNSAEAMCMTTESWRSDAERTVARDMAIVLSATDYAWSKLAATGMTLEGFLVVSDALATLSEEELEQLRAPKMGDAVRRKLRSALLREGFSSNPAAIDLGVEMSGFMLRASNLAGRWTDLRDLNDYWWGDSELGRIRAWTGMAAADRKEMLCPYEALRKSGARELVGQMAAIEDFYPDHPGLSDDDMLDAADDAIDKAMGACEDAFEWSGAKSDTAFDLAEALSEADFMLAKLVSHGAFPPGALQENLAALADGVASLSDEEVLAFTKHDKAAMSAVRSGFLEVLGPSGPEMIDSLLNMIQTLYWVDAAIEDWKRFPAGR